MSQASVTGQNACQPANQTKTPSLRHTARASFGTLTSGRRSRHSRIGQRSASRSRSMSMKLAGRP